MNTFIVLKFVGQLALPPASLLLGLVVAGLLALFRFRRLAKAVLVLAFAEALIFSLPPVSDALMRPLEAEARAEAARAKACCYDAIVVLGGAIAPALPPHFPDPDLADAGDRIWHAARLYHRGVAPRIIVSGGSFAAQVGGPATTEAAAMRQFLMDLRVPSDAIFEEGKSLNTIENMANLRALVQDNPIALVTSGFHMPRALRLARRHGVNASAFPTDWRVPFEARPPWENWIPGIGAEAHSGLALWEYAAYFFDFRKEGLQR